MLCFATPTLSAICITLLDANKLEVIQQNLHISIIIFFSSAPASYANALAYLKLYTLRDRGNYINALILDRYYGFMEPGVA